MTCRVRLREALLPLLVVGLLLAGSTSSAAAGPVLQIRAKGKLRCSGELIASRYVVTAGHCVAKRKAADLRVVAGAGRLRVAKVATVLRAPVTNRRRPDLALLQLTSRSTRTPFRLPKAGTATKRNARISAFGWRTTTRARTTSGRITSARRCGAASRRAGQLCVRSTVRAPAPKCSDATGAALTIRSQSRVLLGVGTRSAKGCGKRSRRNAYVPLTSSAVLGWITSTTEPAPTPGASANDFVASFAGVVSQDSNGGAANYDTALRIDRIGNAGEPAGVSAYSALIGGVVTQCTGTLLLVSASADEVVVTERIDSGKANCVDGGTIVLDRVSGQPSITYSWTRGASDGRTSGVLQRTGTGGR